MHLSNLIKVYDNVLSKEDCNKLIKFYNDNISKVDYYDTPLYKFHQLDLNKSGFNDLSQSFVKHCCPYILNYFKELNFDEYIGIQNFENVKIKKYTKNSDYQFKTHIDSCNKESCIRYLGFMLYLNDNDGYTSFPNLNFRFKPKTGSLLLFPPLWMYPHSGDIPTDEDKYMLISYLHFL